MNENQSPNNRQVDELINTIGKNLQANREILKKSLAYGRLVWRNKRNGEVEIDLELKL